jgi:hypothetical protein
MLEGPGRASGNSPWTNGGISARGADAGGVRTAQGWRYEATYRGQFAGKNLRLSGTQQWRMSTGPYARPCTITLKAAQVAAAAVGDSGP